MPSTKWGQTSVAEVELIWNHGQFPSIRENVSLYCAWAEHHMIFVEKHDKINSAGD